MVICLERGANDLHMVQLIPLPPHYLIKIQIGLTFLVPAYRGCPGNTQTQLFYGPFSLTTRVSRCQKKTSGLYGARGD